MVWNSSTLPLHLCVNYQLILLWICGERKYRAAPQLKDPQITLVAG
nr:MAG TPA_asm: hypothetical protein [Caudoviricetes sp.]